MTITVWLVKVARQVVALLPLQEALQAQVVPVLLLLLRRPPPRHHHHRRPQVAPHPQAVPQAPVPALALAPVAVLVPIPVPARAPVQVRLQVRKQTIEIEKESLRKTKVIILRNKKRREQRLMHRVVVSFS